MSSLHDLTLAGQFADRLALLASGTIVSSGTAREVLDEPALERHFGAGVRIVRTPDGDLVVVPRRSNARSDLERFARTEETSLV